jgi:hypothetical protein
MMLNVPCIAWIISQTPTQSGGPRELRTSIIIWWQEALPPKNKKRKLYYSYPDELMSPLRTNISKAIRRNNAAFGAQGFNIHCTNTYKYVYPVPKIHDNSVIGDEVQFAGFSLWGNYQENSYIPSYVASPEQQREQGIMVGDTKTVLSTVQGTADEQFFYRNLVIAECGPNLDPEMNFEQQGDPVCQTTADIQELKVPAFDNRSIDLKWNLKQFLFYLADNTYRNFQQAGFGARMLAQASKELALGSLILFGDYNYRMFNWSDDPRKPVLVTPPSLSPNAPIDPALDRPGNPRPRGDDSRFPVLGLRYPSIPPPWVVQT